MRDLLARNLQDLRDRIRTAALTAGRAPDTVRLIAVSKTFTAEHVLAVAEAGQLDFGENRVQEALEKHAALQELPGSADLRVRWHLVGTLQSNKARKAASHFSTIHSIDSLKLLEAVETAAALAGAAPDVLVQVDLAGEPTKHGATPDEVAAIVRAGERCRAARLVGLMTVPPYFDNPEDVRPFFAQLRKLRDTLIAQGVNPDSLRELSMGMSHDFETAVQEGATMVRIGTALFGTRRV